MTKEEVLQKITDYCNEKSYTSATLTDGFKDKFADHFQKANPDGDINDETVMNSLKFALNTAFSSASELATVKTNEFASKENDYKNQIEELNKKIAKPKEQQNQPFEIPQEIKDKLDELDKYKNEQSKQEKRKTIMELAKKEVHPNLHDSFDSFAKDFEVKLDKDDKEQADALVAKYQDIMRPSYGSIKPLAPQVSQKRDQEALESIPKITIGN